LEIQKQVQAELGAVRDHEAEAALTLRVREIAFIKPAPGKLGIASGDDLRERFVVIDRCATAEHSGPSNARTFARCIFDHGADDTEAMAFERRVKFGRRHLWLAAEDRDNPFHVNATLP
jgi:hypothetical protein